MKKSFISLGLLFATLSNAAPPIDGWYSSIFGGYAYIPNNLERTINGRVWTDAKYESGYDLGGSLGYKCNPMRYEGEISYFNADLSRFSKHRNVLHRKTLTKVDGYNNAYLAMANVYYDFNGFVNAINPFLGGGFGYAFIDGKFFSPSLRGIKKYAPSESVFAYQGTAGLTYNFAENYALTVAYKYLSTDKVDSFGKRFQAHVGNVGIIYRFDGPIYK